MFRLLRWIWLCLAWRFYPAMSEELREYFRKESGPEMAIIEFRRCDWCGKEFMSRVGGETVCYDCWRCGNG
jgi:hypothetical protein